MKKVSIVTPTALGRVVCVGKALAIGHTRVNASVVVDPSSDLILGQRQEKNRFNEDASFSNKSTTIIRSTKMLLMTYTVITLTVCE